MPLATRLFGVSVLKFPGVWQPSQFCMPSALTKRRMTFPLVFISIVESEPGCAGSIPIDLSSASIWVGPSATFDAATAGGVAADEEDGALMAAGGAADPTTWGADAGGG